MLTEISKLNKQLNPPAYSLQEFSYSDEDESGELVILEDPRHSPVKDEDFSEKYERKIKIYDKLMKDQQKNISMLKIRIFLYKDRLENPDKTTRSCPACRCCGKRCCCCVIV